MTESNHIPVSSRFATELGEVQVRESTVDGNDKLWTYGGRGVQILYDSSADAKYLYIGAREAGKEQSVRYMNDFYHNDWWYIQAMFAPLLFMEKMPRRVLLFGLGGNMVFRFMTKLFGNREESGDLFSPEGIEPTAIEILPEVVKAAVDHYDLDNFCGEIIIADGVKFLSESNREWDYIVCDAYLKDVKCLTGMSSKSWMDIVRDHLSEDGVAFFNLVDNTEELHDLISVKWKHSFAMTSADEDDTDCRLATKHSYSIKVRDLQQRATALQQLYGKKGLNVDAIVNSFRKGAIDTGARIKF